MALHRIKPASYLSGLAKAAGIAREGIDAVIEEGRKPSFYVSEGRIFERGHPLPIGLAQTRERAALILDVAMDPEYDDDFTEACMRRLTDLVAAYREAIRTPPPAAGAALSATKAAA